MSGRPGWPADPDAPVLAPREEEALAQAVRPVGTRGRGATVAAVLIVLAFVVGLVRPWDFLGDGGGGTPGPVADASGLVVAPTPPPAASSSDAGAPGALPTGDGSTSPTCGYPQGWRSATVQVWGGRRARVWTAVDAAQARGPEDPAIPFNAIAGEDFTAIGWCAPVTGDERPPASAQGVLWQVGTDGLAHRVAFRRLEPPAPSSLGELWAPDTGSTPGPSDSPGVSPSASGASGAAPAWPLGGYVIELATPDGTWSRWLGLELRAVPGSTAGPTASPATSASPRASGSPVPRPSG
jgi:hypothetical protein